MITKSIAVKKLDELIGTDLLKKAEEFNITTFVNGKQNKGWKGMVLEKLLDMDTNNAQSPDGEDFELKSTAYYRVKGLWVPKETMAITMINEASLIKNSFYNSHCYEKLKSMIFCAVTWYGQHIQKSELLKISSFDFIENTNLIKEIEADYELIRSICIKSGFTALSGKQGKWIQPRTKGAGHGSTSRAFYAKKGLIKEIIKFGKDE